MSVAPQRFWSEVSVEGGAIRLDGRPVRTPARAELILPHGALARAIAGEWRTVEGAIDPAAMPLTGLANAAIDRIAPDRERFAEGIARYAGADLLCFRADHPAELVARQGEAWDPPLDWARARYDVDFAVTAGIMPVDQPAATIRRLAAAVSARDAFHLAGLAPLVTLSGSLVLGLALAEGAVTEAEAWAAAEVDALWQLEHWGEDELAARAREDKRTAFRAAARFLALLD